MSCQWQAVGLAVGPAAEPLILPPTVADPRLLSPRPRRGEFFFLPGADPPEQARELHGCKAVPEVGKPP